MSTGQFQLGEWVLLTSQKGKKWFIQIVEGPFSCHLGTVQMKEMVGREEGEFVITSKGAKLFMFRPTLQEYIFTMDRRTQIIYPKDLAAMIFYGDIHPGQRVLESGVGSGALSLALLRALGGKGRLVSVEKRLEFAMLARGNITKFFGGPVENHDLIVGDIGQFSCTARFDRVMLDLPEPWHAIAPVSRMVRQGGLLVSLSPNVGQIQLMARELRQNGFASINSFEILKRDWIVDERRARPQDRMRAHTGFIIVAKKTPAFLDNPDSALEEL
jgi:tRNA (adenine57-N1/adenine58-N1)-methyltransferase